MKRVSVKVEVYAGLKRHRGSITTLAKRVGHSREWVRRVLKDDGADDSRIVLEASKLWKELEANKARMMEDAAEIAKSASTMAAY
jgi:transposase-like protein